MTIKNTLEILQRGNDIHHAFMDFFDSVRHITEDTLMKAATALRNDRDSCIKADAVFRKKVGSIASMYKLWDLTRVLGRGTDHELGADLLELAARAPAACMQLYERMQRGDKDAVKTITCTVHTTTPVIINPFINEARTEGKADILKIQNLVLVNGSNFARMSDDTVTSVLAKAQAELKSLKEIEPKTKALEAKITKLSDNINQLITMADKRFDAKGAKTDDDED